MISDDDILATYPVMRQLRPHLAEKLYVEGILRQQSRDRYKLAAVLDGGVVRCVAGYRVCECLAWGKFLYVDDLVSDESTRSNGYGRHMMEWLLQEGRENHCTQMHLDSGVQRHSAHRFYLRERMDIVCYHFAVKIQCP